MLRLTKLRVNRETTPLGLDEKTLCFQYEMVSDRKNSRQSEWRLVIWEEDGETVFDSGKRMGEQKLNIEVRPQLKPRTRYAFSVSVTDNHGESAQAQSWFETGTGGDWTARWIEPVQRPTPRDEDQVKRVRLDSAEAVDQNKVNLFGDKIEHRDYAEFRPALFVRKEFTANGAVKRARLYATAHGLYRAFLNGKRIGNRELAPEITSYHKLLQYQTYDVTQAIKSGGNALGLILADGWWAGRVGLAGDSCQFGNKLGALLELVVDYEDGRRQTVGTDRSWKGTDRGPYRFADLFVGERYDARMELDRFAQAGFDDGGWQNVLEADYGYENLKGQYGPHVACIREFLPQRVLVTPGGDTVLDLGQNISGCMQMTVEGPRGTEVSLEHSEVLDENGNFINNIAGKNKDQKDFYILKGEGREVYRPAFTYHGFRYVKVEGYPGEVRPEQFTACVISTDMEDIGSFRCSDERLNRLAQNIWWSQVANTVSIPTDCPQREKAGWGGDISIYAPTASYLRDMDAFLRRWMDNVRADQLEDGQIPMVIPYLPAYLHIRNLVGSHSSCGWGECVINVPWALYQAYGDRFALEQNYEAMKKWVAYEQRTAETETPEGFCPKDEAQAARQKYLWNTGFHFADWLIPSMSITDDGEAMGMFRSAFLTKELVAPAFYAYSTGMMAQIAEVLGKEQDQKYYADLHAHIKDAFAKEYIGADGTLRADFQGVYVIALQFGLYPEAQKKQGVDRLVALIRENGWRLDTGFLSVPYLMDVLCDNGHADVAYRLLYQDECPSWLYEVKNGATTMWEAWQAILPDGRVTNLSYNHFAFGCVGDWMVRRLAGLRPAAPGYREIVIEPGTDSGLSQAKTEYASPFGQIAVEWIKRGQEVELSFAVPAGVTAHVVLNHDKSRELLYGSGAYRLQYTSR